MAVITNDVITNDVIIDSAIHTNDPPAITFIVIAIHHHPHVVNAITKTADIIIHGDSFATIVIVADIIILVSFICLHHCYISVSASTCIIFADSICTISVVTIILSISTTTSTSLPASISCYSMIMKDYCYYYY